MDWFSSSYDFNKSCITIAHITDCHLFKDEEGRYFGVNTAQHLRACLKDIKTKNVDLIIFGGDLTQDHSTESYQLFAKLVAEAELNCPVFWLPGNHDDMCELQAISTETIHLVKCISFIGGQVLLLNSKGDTPAGWVSEQHLQQIEQQLRKANTKTIAFCHHNPLPISGYLDKHMLENGPQLLNTLVNSGYCQALFHGHVHNDYHWQYRQLDIYATPATSAQFSKGTKQWQQYNDGPQYRLIELSFEQQQLKLATRVLCLSA